MPQSTYDIYFLKVCQVCVYVCVYIYILGACRLRRGRGKGSSRNRVALIYILLRELPWQAPYAACRLQELCR